MAKAADQLADVVHATGERADEALRRRASELEKLFDDVEELLRRVSDNGDLDLAKLRRRVEASVDRVKEATRHGVHAAVEGTRQAARATDEYVHRNPWTALGVSAAAGLVVGALLCRR